MFRTSGRRRIRSLGVYVEVMDANYETADSIPGLPTEPRTTSTLCISTENVETLRVVALCLTG